MSNGEGITIKVSNVSKTFKLPHEKKNCVKSLFVSMFHGRRTYEKQQALKDISFEVKKGEFFGIVGRNGSGKSTLLKLLAGIYTPDSGHIQVNGKLTPFIELGVGFNPELTGRENVFLNGALLGFNRKEMAAMYDEIVEFAELEKFMDQKLKNYSSGMQVRLAFSIAIRAQSDILILDEVLAVGDEAFQRKCLDIFDSYKLNKKTIVLVTHDMSVVERYCDRAILINNSRLMEEGKPSIIAKKYSALNDEAIDKSTDKQNRTRGFNGKLRIRILNKDNNEVSSFDINDQMKVDLSWPSDLKVKHAGVAILKSTGDIIFATNTLELKDPIKTNNISYTVKLNLLPGRYFIMAGLFGKNDKEVVDFIGEGPTFSIRKINKVWQGITVLENRWTNE